ncbi:uncharacterized protein LOC131633764 [Vicia villosa]|uniref:uncharacterized protein LOC131633764 n=1 Tax=Vicia villosa TaxID=3911 RepID=UPI00273B5C59|nr:uncharacterized protein LOC131633764 [Vicia villosa]
MEKNTHHSPLFDLNEDAPIQDHSGNSMERHEEIDTGVVESRRYSMALNSSYNGLIEGEPLPKRKRKETTHWTVDEHRLFLKGLHEYGKGRWKDISKYVVLTKTSTQVASHAQKFFIHQNGTKRAQSKRKSIHDTTSNISNSDIVVALPIYQQQANICPVEQQHKITLQETTLNNNDIIVTPLVEQSNEIPPFETTLNNKDKLLTPLVEQSNEILPFGTTLNDNNDSDYSIPSPTKSYQDMQQREKHQIQTMCLIQAINLTPRDMKNVAKMCNLLEKILKS